MTSRLACLLLGALVVAPCRSQIADPADSPDLAATVGTRLYESRRPSRQMRSSTATFSHIVSFRVNLDDRQSLGLDTEFLKLASFYFKIRGYEEQPDWKFKAVPFTLAYERLLSSPDRRVVPVVGVGVSYYLTQLKTRLPTSVTGPQTASMPVNTYVDKRWGMGWGLQATAGIRARVSERTFVQLQARYRRVDGFGVTESEGSAARFGVFDFAVGFGFSI